MHRTLRTAVVAAALALASEPSRAADHATLETMLGDVVENAVTAMDRVAAGDRAGAVTLLSDAGVVASAFRDALEVPDSRTSLGREFGPVRSAAKTLSSSLRTAQRRTDDPLVSSHRAAASIRKSARLGVRTLARARRVPARGVAFVETNARTAGFHGTDSAIGFTVFPGLASDGGPCLEDPVVQVFDVTGNGAILTTVTALPPDRRGNPRFEILTGSVAGSGRVEVTACGVTRRWLVYNRGVPDTFPRTVTVTADRFDGLWTGSYSGRATLADGTQVPFTPGSVAFSVAGGVLTVTDPGSGTGSVSPFGKTLFSGRGAVDDTTYSYQGTFTSTFSGTASASGNWTARFPGGTARGTWRASR